MSKRYVIEGVYDQNKRTVKQYAYNNAELVRRVTAIADSLVGNWDGFRIEVEVEEIEE